MNAGVGGRPTPCVVGGVDTLSGCRTHSSSKRAGGGGGARGPRILNDIFFVVVPNADRLHTELIDHKTVFAIDIFVTFIEKLYCTETHNIVHALKHDFIAAF